MILSPFDYISFRLKIYNERDLISRTFFCNNDIVLTATEQWLCKSLRSAALFFWKHVQIGLAKS